MYREFPCALCGASCADLICRGCDRDLPRLATACNRCGLPSPSPVCVACQVRPPCWECLVVPYTFAYPIDKVIHEFKYFGSVFWGAFLAREMVRRGLASGTPLPEALVPVPAHPHRLADRGFNQAVELARGIGRELDIPVLTDKIVRVGSHPQQVGLTANQRRKNVHGAFAAAGRDVVTGRVAIVDDILTTGATAKEMAKVLLRSGANEIQVWVVARTPKALRPR
ncbi:MAG: hypothetical protein A3H91_07235 [Gammaproteobacteria bacterium RIFCSPLOWO2_02_FULL_61_13]|nr:MAG: hypothetical protein A3H91_07235 [Gammaproteobacteria bacterium RIFCSPLOWO2_02_FULL_61_13]